MSTFWRVGAKVALALALLGGAGCSSSPPPEDARTAPRRTCPGCGAQIIDPNIKKCPTCDSPLPAK